MASDVAARFSRRIDDARPEAGHLRDDDAAGLREHRNANPGARAVILPLPPQPMRPCGTRIPARQGAKRLSRARARDTEHTPDTAEAGLRTAQCCAGCCVAVLLYGTIALISGIVLVMTSGLDSSVGRG